jgi:hypothetical protein
MIKDDNYQANLYNILSIDINSLPVHITYTNVDLELPEEEV